MLIIPQKLLEEVGFFESEIEFDLVFENGVPSLLGRTTGETVEPPEEVVD